MRNIPDKIRGYLSPDKTSLRRRPGISFWPAFRFLLTGCLPCLSAIIVRLLSRIREVATRDTVRKGLSTAVIMLRVLYLSADRYFPSAHSGCHKGESDRQWRRSAAGNDTARYVFSIHHSVRPPGILPGPLKAAACFTPGFPVVIPAARGDLIISARRQQR